MQFKKKFYCLSLLLVTTLSSGQDQEQRQENSSNPTSGLSSFLKGVTGSLNGAIKQINTTAAEAKNGKPRPTQEQTAAVSASSVTTPVAEAQSGKARPTPEQSVSATTSPAAMPSSLDDAVLLSATPLSGVFAKHPYDGTEKSNYPKVAITVIDWAQSDCWRARATIWWSPKKSEHVSPFKVCWRNSLSRATDNAVNYQLFMRQMAPGHTGNLRTEGPKAPMMAYPMPDPFGISNYAKGQQAISFIQQVIMDTGWQPGAPTNIWVVKYDTSALPVQAQQ